MAMDREIAERYMEATRDLTQDQAADLIGVSQRTISTWRGASGPPKRLAPALRKKILEVLETAVNGRVEYTSNGRGGDARGGIWDDLVGTDGADLRAALVAELRAIRELDEPERMKMLYRDSAASLIGQAAIFAAEVARATAEEAARVRAVAVLEAERNGAVRMTSGTAPHFNPRLSNREGEDSGVGEGGG